MATRVLSQNLRKLASFSLLNLSQRAPISPSPEPLRPAIASFGKCLNPFYQFSPPWMVRWASHSSVNLVLSDDGKPKFEIEEVEPSKKRGYLTKKRLKLQRKREKKKRKEANKNDPRRIRPKGKKIKQKFPTPEARLKYKIEKAKLKEAMLVEKLKKYEIAKAQGPMAKQDDLDGEERFYLKKVSQKKSNYVPVGRRGVFGGVILNMHLHWKKHETVKVICKPCKPGQIQEYASEIARLSGGIPINTIGNDTIVFYRGKNYVQPDVMSPVDTLSKKKALEKSKYEQSLETVRRFIAVSEKELELYYRHIALYGNPQSQNVDPVYCDDRRAASLKMEEPSQGKDLSHMDNDGFSDITDASESDEEANPSEYDDNDDETGDNIGTVLYDHGGFKRNWLGVPNRAHFFITVNMAASLWSPYRLAHPHGQKAKFGACKTVVKRIKYAIPATDQRYDMMDVLVKKA
uniref:CRM domain-containing protein n=1 Tax=Oryza barthii TaxID=65489 RepID=A0A0D3EYV8_9ORYZ